MQKQKIIIVSGPTASGKSQLALEAALSLREKGIRAEIVSADSAQVYRYMDIGTAKLTTPEMQGITHHLIDIVNPDEHFDAELFRRAALEIIERVSRGSGVAILVGGTGFWIRALLYGLFPGPGRDATFRDELKALAQQKGSTYLHEMLAKLDPKAAIKIHPNDLSRLIRGLEVHKLTGRTLSEHFADQSREENLNALHIALQTDRVLLYERINQRVDEMMAKGLAAEVTKLREMGFGPELESQKIIGYRQLHQHLDGEIGLDETVHEIKKATRHYARRQMVWLRGQPDITWLDGQKEREKFLGLTVKFLEAKQ
jgi:tRNA dimethylallyltransferase